MRSKSRHTNRVSEPVAVAIAGISGIIAAWSPAAPTGQSVVDGVLVGAVAAATAYAGASAPWWVVVVAGGAAFLTAGQLALALAAALAVVGGLWVGARRASDAGLRAASIGVACNVLARAELNAMLGLTTTVAVVVGGLVFVTGIRRRPRAIRHASWTAVGTLAGLALLFSVGFGIAAAESRASLLDGRRSVEAGISALKQGDYEAASARFGDAAVALRAAEDQLRRPWTIGASAVPVIAQHRRAVVELSSTGAEAAEVVSRALAEIDPAALRASAGRIDLAAVSALRRPFTDVDVALDDMAAAVAEVRSPWLLPPVEAQLDAVASSLADNAPLLDNARAAVDLAPDLLGGNGARVYVVLFTTPSEARGLGGLPGNYAELTITDGQMSMTGFGRVSHLERTAQRQGARISGPEEFVRQYGTFGFDDDGAGLVGDASFRNVTISPNFPYVADVVRQLYPQATGTPIDGVIVMDPYVVEALLAYTGPIQLASVGRELTAENASEYLLLDQYLIGADDNVRRIDALEEVAQLTFDALLAAELPDPTRLARDLGPLAEQRRLLIWTDDEQERSLLRSVGLLGEIPAHAGGDGWSVAVTNGSGNKIDSFLVRKASYRSTTDDGSGETSAVLRLELTNTAPSAGLPDYVIGNLVGLPPGSSRLFVSCYSPLTVSAVTLDSQPVEVDIGREMGWNVYSRYVDIGPGATATLELELTGILQRPDELVTWEQPLVLPLEISDDRAAVAETTVGGG